VATQLVKPDCSMWNILQERYCTKHYRRHVGTIYLLKLLTIPHWESLSAAYK